MAAGWAWPSPSTLPALATEYEKVRAFAERMFGSGDVLLERYFPTVRHIEVQILGLVDGSVVALGERECSVQRRNQKVVEESPSPALNDQQRRDLLAAAVRAGQAVGYRNAGTVECLFDPASGNSYFLEMNTRLQVEHPVTEAVFGLDLVEEQLRIASGLAPTFGAVPPEPRGHAIELRINAEDPKRFLPGPGAITTWVEPQGDGVRVDSGYAAGTIVTPALRLADGQADRLRRDPRRGDRAGEGGGGRVRDRRAEAQPAVPRRGAGVSRNSSAVPTTPAWWAGCGQQSAGIASLRPLPGVDQTAPGRQ